jgi:spore coat polysaccharide biosynthesis protein SpsF (cytidylyltransferase family)
MLWHVVDRVRRARGIEDVAVATSSEPGDEPIRRLCRDEGIPVFAGSEHDVLDRFYRAASHFGADPLVRITADCPFVDPATVAKVIDLYHSAPHDHVGVAAGAGASLLGEGRYPDGLDAECVRFAALQRAWREATDGPAREHVTFYIWRNPGTFRCGVLRSDGDYGHLRLTVDQDADYQVASRIYGALYSETRPFTLADVLKFLADNPVIADSNRAHMASAAYRVLLDPWVRSGALSAATPVPTARTGGVEGGPKPSGSSGA